MSNDTTSNKFRMQPRNGVHITYKGHIDHGLILGLLAQHGQLLWHSVVHELGHANTMDGDDTAQYAHTHAACNWERRPNIRRATVWDTTVDGETVHPHIQNIRDMAHATTIYEVYHRKEPVLLSQSERGPHTAVSLGQRIKDAPSLLEACTVAGIEFKTCSDLVAIRNDKTRQPDCPKKWEGGEWQLDLVVDNSTMFIWGPSGVGKTQWAIHCCTNPLLVSEFDQLKSFDSERHDAIIFDDTNFSKLDRNQCIHIFDHDLPREIKCR